MMNPISRGMNYYLPHNDTSIKNQESTPSSSNNEKNTEDNKSTSTPSNDNYPRESLSLKTTLAHNEIMQKLEIDGTSKSTPLEQVKEKLNTLGRPQEGWFFEKSLGPVERLSQDELKGIKDIISDTNQVKNIISFGARDGGFELAMQFRHDLDIIGNNVGGNASHNYLDAISLQKNKFTELKKIEGLDVFKMQNPFWDVGFKNGIHNAKKMVFFITPEWLSSQFCKQEFQWLSETKNKNIQASFAIFNDVNKNDPFLNEIKSYSKENNAKTFELKGDENGLLDVSIEGSKNLVFKRSLQPNEFEMIKKEIM